MCITPPNFVKIARTVSEIWQLNGFSKWRLFAIFVFENQTFNDRSGVESHFASPCQILWRSVKPLLRYRDLCNFQDASRRHLGFSKFRTVNLLYGVNMCHRANVIKPVKRLRRCGDLTVIKITAGCQLAFLDTCLDHPRRALCALYNFDKFGWNRCSSFDNMKLLIFRPFGLKTPI